MTREAWSHGAGASRRHSSQPRDFAVLINKCSSASLPGRSHHCPANRLCLYGVISPEPSQSKQIKRWSNRYSDALCQPELLPLASEQAWAQDMDRTERQLRQLLFQLALGSKVKVFAGRVSPDRRHHHKLLHAGLYRFL